MTPVLTDAEIAHMRADVVDTALPMTCAIQRADPGAVDDYGQPTPGALTVIATVACMYTPQTAVSSGGETVGPSAVYVERPAAIVLPALTDVTEADQVTVTDTDGVIRTVGILEVRRGLNETELRVEELSG